MKVLQILVPNPCFRKKKRGEIRQNQNRFNFQKLPRDVKAIILNFLTYSDAVTLLEACKSLRLELGLFSFSSPLTSKAAADKFYTPRRPFETELFCFGGIVPERKEGILANHSNSLYAFTCDWNDHAWLNCKGKIYIVAQDRTPDNIDYSESSNLLESKPFFEGRIVAASATAKHQTESLMLCFNPKPKEVYQLWCNIGGSGRGRRQHHALHLKNMTIHQLCCFGHGENFMTFQFAQKYTY